MTFLKEVLTPASIGLIDLLPLLIIFVIFIHIYFISVLFASNGLSLKFKGKEDEISKKLSNLFFGKPAMVFLLSILPILMLAPLYRLTFFDSTMKFEQYLFTGLVVLIVALILLFFYRKEDLFAGGALGTLTLLLYIFLFAITLSLFLFPEKWPFIEGFFPFPLFAVTPIFLVILIIAISFINTGAALGFIYMSWGEKRLPEGSGLLVPITKMSRSMILTGSLILPPILFLFLFTLPGYSVGKTIFPPAILILLFTILSAYTAYPLTDKKKGSERGKFTFAFIISILLTLAFSVIIFSFQKYSNLDRTDWAKIEAEKIKQQVEAERMELYSKSMKISSEYGAQIYKERCTSCHNFDKTLLGPSFNSIIPKYKDNPENMIKFILDPVKINPDLPSMPDPGLTTLQARSVTKFILEKENKKSGEKSE